MKVNRFYQDVEAESPEEARTILESFVQDEIKTGRKAIRKLEITLPNRNPPVFSFNTLRKETSHGL